VVGKVVKDPFFVPGLSVPDAKMARSAACGLLRKMGSVEVFDIVKEPVVVPFTVSEIPVSVPTLGSNWFQATGCGVVPDSE
jgi:hypothetical protein